MQHRFQCDNCDKNYATNWSLKVHVQRAHEKSRPYKCSFENCNLAFFSKQHLERHEIIHSREKNFICSFEDCSESFAKESELKKHQCSHTNELPCPCPEPGCKSSFIYPSKLKWHMKVVHPKEKKQICGFENCGEQFAKLSELQAHIREKHPKIFVCNVCQKRFKDKKSIDRHTKTHSILNNELYVCTVDGCNKSFSEKLGLSLHNRVAHSENSDNRFECNYPGCNKTYCNTALLQKHTQKKHVNSNNDPPIVESTKNHLNGKQMDVFGALGIIPDTVNFDTLHKDLLL